MTKFSLRKRLFLCCILLEDKTRTMKSRSFFETDKNILYPQCSNLWLILVSGMIPLKTILLSTHSHAKLFAACLLFSFFSFYFLFVLIFFPPIFFFILIFRSALQRTISLQIIIHTRYFINTF